MKLIYDGMFDEMEVPAAGIVAKRGEPVDVPDEVGASLLRAGTEIADDGTETAPARPDWKLAEPPVMAAKARKEE